MMLSKEIKKEIRQIVIESNIFVDAEGQQVNDNDPLHLDSMSLMWLITGLEERFGIEINFREVDLRHFETVDSIQNYMESLIKE
ncbi:MAG TPA: acyl carrier protein [Clostridia bacterium]|nr:acyl carrier protein [Clostridia bacterium]